MRLYHWNPCYCWNKICLNHSDAKKAKTHNESFLKHGNNDDVGKATMVREIFLMNHGGEKVDYVHS